MVFKWQKDRLITTWKNIPYKNMRALAQRDHPTQVHVYRGMDREFQEEVTLRQNPEDDQQAGRYGQGCRGRISMCTGMDTHSHPTKQATLKGQQKPKHSGQKMKLNKWEDHITKYLVIVLFDLNDGKKQFKIFKKAVTTQVIQKGVAGETMENRLNRNQMRDKETT